MEANIKSKKVFQADFLYKPQTREIEFYRSPGQIIPAGNERLFSIEKFASFFIKQEQQALLDFFIPENWTDRSTILTMSTEPENHIKGESCSIFLQQNGLEDTHLSGTVLNISQFLPGEFLFRDLAVFVDGLANIRRITHDLNNQFQIITGFGSALEDEMTDPELKECATNVMDAVGKAIDQNKDLRKFFPPKDKPKLYLPQFSSIETPSAVQNQTIKHTETESTAPEKSGSVAEPAKQQTGILVIDDEPLVQRFLCEMLKRLKYSSVGCTTGSEAINAMSNDPGAFSLAIVDMNLPDISSEELFDKLVQLRNDLKVVLISGDNLGESSQRILNKGAHGFLQKPTTIKTLSETISQILAGQKPAS